MIKTTHVRTEAMTNPDALDRLRDHILRLSFAFVDTINARDWDSPLWDIVSTNFTSKPEALSGGYKRLNGRDAFLNSMRDLAKQFPNWRIDVQSAEVNFNDDHTYAGVFTHTLSTGEPEHIARPAMTRLEYRLVRNRWWFVSHEILPGPGVDAMVESPY